MIADKDSQYLFESSSTKPPSSSKTIQRRAANRISAQLSRARKRALVESLLAENKLLRHRVEMLDSQPDLIFGVLLDGSVSYVSERTAHLLSQSVSCPSTAVLDPSISWKDSEDISFTRVNVTHMREVLSPQSLLILQATLKECLCGSQPIVKEIVFHDNINGLSTGFMRCALVEHRPVLEHAVIPGDDPIGLFVADDSEGDGGSVTTTAAATKRSKMDSRDCMLVAGIQALQTLGKKVHISGQGVSGRSTVSSSSSSSTSTSSSSSVSISVSGSSSSNIGGPSTSTIEGLVALGGSSWAGVLSSERPTPEFICVIRQADQSVPLGLTASGVFSSFLSTAVMQAHDKAGQSSSQESGKGTGSSTPGNTSCTSSSACTSLSRGGGSRASTDSSC